MIKKILYITHYGFMFKDFYCDSKTGKPKKVIGDGGSNIHIHLIQCFLKKGHRLFFSTYKSNYQYLAFFDHFPAVKYLYFWTPEEMLGHYDFWLDNLYKIFFLPLRAIWTEVKYDYLFSNTDFLPDVIYAFILKLRNQKAKWVASYFLDAPKPWQKDNPYRISLRRYLNGLLYWVSQRFSYWLIKGRADFVLVTSKPDVEKFITAKRGKEKIVVVQGGVDIAESEKYLKGRPIPVVKRKYDACFLGRFHYQKGVLELVDIWKEVCRQRPGSRLALIGNGPLEAEVKMRVKRYGLKKNIDLFGFKDGQEKFQIFKQAKIIVHPATYDSGGMSAAEGMAWGLPGVSFDLESLKTYYPRGMVKIPQGDYHGFAKEIIKLLSDKKYYVDIASEARNFILEEWDWNKRANLIYKEIFENE